MIVANSTAHTNNFTKKQAQAALRSTIAFAPVSAAQVQVQVQQPAPTPVSHTQVLQTSNGILNQLLGKPMGGGCVSHSIRHNGGGGITVPAPVSIPVPHTRPIMFVGGGGMTVPSPFPFTTGGGGGMTVSSPFPFTTGGGGGGVKPSPAHTTFPSQGWSSAGCIVVEENYRSKRTGRRSQAIFLGYSSHRNCWELFYGKTDLTDSSPFCTATREAREESGNLFDFSRTPYDPSSLVTSHNGRHHAMVIRVAGPHRTGIQSRDFATNLAQLKANGAPKEWREMTAITRIFIDEATIFGIMVYDSRRGNFCMDDVNGNRIEIFSRDAEFIRDMIRQGMHLTTPVYPLHSTVDTSHTFLRGTTQYSV